MVNGRSKSSEITNPVTPIENLPFCDLPSSHHVMRFLSSAKPTKLFVGADDFRFLRMLSVSQFDFSRRPRSAQATRELTTSALQSAPRQRKHGSSPSCLVGTSRGFEDWYVTAVFNPTLIPLDSMTRLTTLCICGHIFFSQCSSGLPR